jgi:hypothetical protein
MARLAIRPVVGGEPLTPSALLRRSSGYQIRVFFIITFVVSPFSLRVVLVPKALLQPEQASFRRQKIDGIQIRVMLERIPRCGDILDVLFQYHPIAEYIRERCPVCLDDLDVIAKLAQTELAGGRFKIPGLEGIFA